MKKYIFLVLFYCVVCSPVDIEPARQEVNIFRGLYQTGKYSDNIKSLQVIFRLPHLKKNLST
ncbi:type IV secretion protein Rhs [Escherichia coli]|nr:type IV secretion protein Rhs [Escherichia coli]